MVLKMNDHGQIVSEDVGLNFRENFFKIQLPAPNGKTPATVIHSSTEVKLILFKFCFLIRQIY